MAKCAHCGNKGATNLWHPALCADGRKKRSKRLCDPCDIELNRMVLEFFNYPNAADLMSAYTEGAAND